MLFLFVVMLVGVGIGLAPGAQQRLVQIGHAQRRLGQRVGAAIEFAPADCADCDDIGSQFIYGTTQQTETDVWFHTRPHLEGDYTLRIFLSPLPALLLLLAVGAIVLLLQAPSRDWFAARRGGRTP